MKKIIKLNESDLLKIIDKVISEQELGRTIPSNFGQDIISQVKSNNQNIILIQKKLKDLRYNLGKYGSNGDGVDGEYGKATRAAVRKFQLDNKPLIPDGIVGPRTAEVLGVDPLSKEQQNKLKMGYTIRDKQPIKSPNVVSPSSNKTKKIELWPGLTPAYSNQITSGQVAKGKLPNIPHKGCGHFINTIAGRNISSNAWMSYHYRDGRKIFSAFDQVNPKSYEDIVARIEKRGPSDGEDTKENQEIRALVKNLNGFTGTLQLGDRVGIFWEPSKHYELALLGGIEASNKFRKPTFNTHTGIVGAMEDGEPIIFHSVEGRELAEPASDFKILWVKRG